TLKVVDRDQIRQLVVFGVVEFHFGDRPDNGSDWAGRAFGDADRVITRLVPLGVAQAGVADQPVELRRIALRVEGHGDDVTGLPGVYVAGQKRAGLIGGQIDKLAGDRAVAHEEDAHFCAVARVDVGQRDESVDAVRIRVVAGVFVKEEYAAGLSVADRA